MNNNLEQQHLHDDCVNTYNGLLDIVNNKTVTTLSTCPLTCKFKVRGIRQHKKYIYISTTYKDMDLYALQNQGGMWLFYTTYNKLYKGLT